MEHDIPHLCRTGASALMAIALLGATPCLAGSETTVENKSSVRVECISPNGHSSEISDKPGTDRQIASVVDRETISCALPEGLTTFIIALPKNELPDRLTFLNENADARGELRIAVANSPLPADSAKWTEVEGIVPFSHKRLFNLSMLGIETKFVRLSFRVEKSEEDSAESSQAAVSLESFRNSALAAAINSKFVKLHGDRNELNFAALSVGPLSASANK